MARAWNRLRRIFGKGRLIGLLLLVDLLVLRAWDPQLLVAMRFKFFDMFQQWLPRQEADVPRHHRRHRRGQPGRARSVAVAALGAGQPGQPPAPGRRRRHRLRRRLRRARSQSFDRYLPPAAAAAERSQGGADEPADQRRHLRRRPQARPGRARRDRPHLGRASAGAAARSADHGGAHRRRSPALPLPLHLAGREHPGARRRCFRSRQFQPGRRSRRHRAPRAARGARRRRHRAVAGRGDPARRDRAEELRHPHGTGIWRHHLRRRRRDRRRRLDSRPITTPCSTSASARTIERRFVSAADVIAGRVDPARFKGQPRARRPLRRRPAGHPPDAADDRHARRRSPGPAPGERSRRQLSRPPQLCARPRAGGRGPGRAAADRPGAGGERALDPRPPRRRQRRPLRRRALAVRRARRAAGLVVPGLRRHGHLPAAHLSQIFPHGEAAQAGGGAVQPVSLAGAGAAAAARARAAEARRRDQDHHHDVLRRARLHLDLRAAARRSAGAAPPSSTASSTR